MLAGIFFWWRLTSDHLVRYAADDALLYFHARQPMFAGNDTEIPIPFENYWTVVARRFFLNDASVPRALSANASELAWWIRKNESGEFDWLLAFRLRDRDLSQSIFDHLTYWTAIDGRTIIVASSQAALEQFQIAHLEGGGSDESSERLIDRVRRSRIGRAQVFVYLPMSSIASSLPSETMFTKIVQQFLIGDIAIRFQQPDTIWRFRAQAETSLPQLEESATLPPTIPAGAALIISGANLPALLESLAQTNSELLDFQKFVITNWPVVPTTELALVAEVFKSPVTLALYPDDQSLFGYHFLIVFPKADARQLSDVETFLQTLVALRLPTSIQRRLPDGSTIPELRVEPNRYTWESSVEDTVELRSLPVPDLGITVAYHVAEEYWLLGSSPRLITQALVATSTPLQAATECSVSGSVRAWTMIDPQYLFSQSPDLAELFAETEVVLRPAGRRTVSGCVVAE